MSGVIEKLDEIQLNELEIASVENDYVEMIDEMVEMNQGTEVHPH